MSPYPNKKANGLITMASTAGQGTRYEEARCADDNERFAKIMVSFTSLSTIGLYESGPSQRGIHWLNLGI